MPFFASILIIKKYLYICNVSAIHDCITTRIYNKQDHRVIKKLLFKKGINNVVFILLMIAPTIIWGQSDSLVRTYQSPCQSEWTEYNFTEQNSIVRSNDQQ